MKCLNCGKKIPRGAKRCQYCEAPVERAPTREEEQAVHELLGQMPPEALDELAAALEGSDTAEEFADRIFVGDCPKCGSPETGNCENDPEIDCLLVGRCFQCGQLWCTECATLLKPDAPTCPCWEEDDWDES